jgi:hypothetical protein
MRLLYLQMGHYTRAFPHFPLQSLCFCFRMRVLLTTIFLVRLRDISMLQTTYLNFHTQSVFGIIKPNKTINMIWNFFIFFIIGGKLLKNSSASLNVVNSYTFFKAVYCIIQYFIYMDCNIDNITLKKKCCPKDLH